MDRETIGVEGARIKGFSEIVGQEAAVGFLKKVVSGTKIPHAYLFTGIAGIGKTTAALAFARALNCLDPVDGDGCGRCVPCRQIAGGNFPDLERIRPDGRFIKIDQIRELTRRIGYKTVSGRYRVSLLEQAGTMTLEAANAFLKTLEEPPPGNILILDALDKKDLLPTILSRCQRVAFRPVPAKFLAAWLHEVNGVPEKTAAVLAGLSEGSVGRALRMAGSSELVDRRLDHLQTIMRLPEQSPTEILTAAARYAQQEKKRTGEREDEDEGGLNGVLGLWKTWFRDMLVLRSSGPREVLVLGDEDGALKKTSATYTIDGLIESLLILERAQKDLSRSRNVELMMETTLLALKRATLNQSRAGEA
ncbi:MAG: DNA polymerase III subunit delta' [Thermodesulfobacteriota bacterium]